MVLSSRDNVAGFGDTYPLPGSDYTNALCSCGAPLDACTYRQRFYQGIQARGFPGFRFEKSYPFPPALFYQANRSTHLSALYRCFPGRAITLLFPFFFRLHRAWMEALQEMGPYELYFDGSKYLQRAELMRRIHPDLYLVHVVKDPRSYVVSMRKRNQEMHLELIIKYWIAYNQAAFELGRRVGHNRYLRVQYEDIATAPRESMNTILTFLGLPEETEPVVRVDRQKTHVLGNRSRLTIEQVENRAQDWRAALTPEMNDQILDAVAQAKGAKSLSWLRVTDAE
jgi:hypothetical protein